MRRLRLARLIAAVALVGFSLAFAVGGAAPAGATHSLITCQSSTLTSNDLNTWTGTVSRCNPLGTGQFTLVLNSGPVPATITWGKGDGQITMDVNGTDGGGGPQCNGGLFADLFFTITSATPGTTSAQFMGTTGNLSEWCSDGSGPPFTAVNNGPITF
jgi:hypothetical protein